MNIVVTGASRGVGYHICLQLAGMGPHTIFALSRDTEKLKELIAEADRRKLGGKIIPIHVDLTSSESIASAGRIIQSKVDSLQVLINNAGLLVKKPFEQLNADDWKLVYSVNVFGVVELTRELLPLLKVSADSFISHIVNISSIGGVQGSMKFIGLSAYSSSKAAVIGVTECLAEEFRDYNIRVNCLALGSVSTEMFKEAFPQYEAAVTPEAMANYISDFALTGQRFFNGKVIPVTATTP